MPTSTTKAPGSPLRLLHDLQRSGELGLRYPQVRELVRELSDLDLIRAGHLLARLNLDEVSQAHPDIPVVTVAITGHSTLATLVPPLTAEFARHGLLIRPHIGAFDSYIRDLDDPGSPLYTAEPDLTLCVLDATVVFDELPVPWRPTDVARVLDQKLRLFERLAARFTATSRGTLVLNTMPLIRRFAAQLVDRRSRAALGAVWHESGARLLRLPERNPAVVVLDLDPLIAEGIEASDSRLSVYAKAEMSPGLLARYAREAGHLARHVVGHTKKCLVLDLDNTLWHGVLAEDGAQGIEVAGTHRGNAFRTFQKVVKQLGSQGVLLAVVSKNDLDPVIDVIRTHPDMVLREGDFVRVIANWRPKHHNLADLARALNLSTDSFVFADDSPHECGFVEHELPGVAVVRVDDEPAWHTDRLLRDGWFDIAELTDEDRTRTAKYQADLARTDFLDGFTSTDDYLRELRISVRMEPAREPDVARISQLTLRTNQFNMTTVRLQPTELRALMSNPRSSVFAIRASDRFGDNGLVGAVFLRRTGKIVHIDNFLMSCRVFARGLEGACLSSVLRHARTTGATAVLAAYHPTPRNGMAAAFYRSHGFDQVGDNGATLTFRHTLEEIASPPGHIRLAAELGEASWEEIASEHD